MVSTLQIRTLPVGQLKTNCYLITDTKSSETMIIDPGDDTDYITQTVSDNKLKPVRIVATHGHFDHILAVSELKLIYKIPFLLHKADEFLLARMISSAHYFLHTQPTSQIPTIDQGLISNQLISVGTFTFSVLYTPGHTPGSICLYNKRENLLFCGDTIFADGGVGRTDFQYSAKDSLLNSLGVVLNLPLKTTLYPGHGPATTIMAEKKHHEDTFAHHSLKSV